MDASSTSTSCYPSDDVIALDSRSAISNYALAGRCTSSHAFKDLRSASVARLRKTATKKRYQNFYSVNMGQLNCLAYSLPKCPWGGYEVPVDKADIPLRRLTKRDLFRHAKDNPTPKTKRTYFCCRACDPAGFVWGRERAKLQQRELNRLLPGGRGVDALWKEHLDAEDDLRIQDHYFASLLPGEESVSQYCVEEEDGELSKENRVFDALFDKAMEAWQMKEHAKEDASWQLCIDSEARSEVEDTWDLIHVSEPEYSDDESQYDILSEFSF